MIVEVKVPSPGESITEVELTTWLVKDGDIVGLDQELAEIESDKATLSLNAVEAGKINIKIPEGETVKVGSIACTIDTSFAATEPAPIKDEDSEKKIPNETREEVESEEKVSSVENVLQVESERVKATPLAKKIMEEEGLSIDDVLNGLKKLSASDVKKAGEVIAAGNNDHESSIGKIKSRVVNRKKMTQLRKKLSQRLVSVKNETAMLTTFNEVDMSAIIGLRKKYQNDFIDKYGIKLGFMSFFIKAASIALMRFPMVNSMIDGDEILTPEFVDVSVAVQAPKGLMVPVIRNVEELSLADIERELKVLAEKARSGKLSLDEMKGGTFTVTNGGVFGSMLSTPLINPPQSAILGMHNIVERPVAVNGKVEIRPVMYLALSYDHRLIDGKDSVGFLVNLKEMLENPVRLLFNGDEPEKAVLEL
ncbi:MAG: 2-oxoglutarate dehydrogenase complex dihydrolipoyllysine-residue succinyltransferase [Chlorobi bacterium]|nr:2-oxoglutarate dehydrogenase complex dihydrolipoyllysine-residue succinyltransferase [Chlorobiota bacterium]